MFASVLTLTQLFYVASSSNLVMHHSMHVQIIWGTEVMK